MSLARQDRHPNTFCFLSLEHFLTASSCGSLELLLVYSVSRQWMNYYLLNWNAQIARLISQPKSIPGACSLSSPRPLSSFSQFSRMLYDYIAERRQGKELGGMTSWWDVGFWYHLSRRSVNICVGNTAAPEILIVFWQASSATQWAGASPLPRSGRATTAFCGGQ